LSTFLIGFSEVLNNFLFSSEEYIVSKIRNEEWEEEIVSGLLDIMKTSLQIIQIKVKNDNLCNENVVNLLKKFFISAYLSLLDHKKEYELIQLFRSYLLEFSQLFNKKSSNPDERIINLCLVLQNNMVISQEKIKDTNQTLNENNFSKIKLTNSNTFEQGSNLASLDFLSNLKFFGLNLKISKPFVSNKYNLIINITCNCMFSLFPDFNR
jgi:hypothetical protein